MYFCAAFYAEQDLDLAEKETELRLEALFAPGGVADIASTVLVGDESLKASQEVSAAEKDRASLPRIRSELPASLRSTLLNQAQVQLW